MPNIPPKKTIGSKDLQFVEERRLFLQDFLVNISKYDYLWQSEEFTAFVRSTQHTDLMAKYKSDVKRKIQKATTPQNDGILSDRIERYEDIIDKIAVVDPEFRKYCQKSTAQMKSLLVKTQKYIMII